MFSVEKDLQVRRRLTGSQDGTIGVLTGVRTMEQSVY